MSAKGIIFDLQTYALFDGPGIRTTVFFKGCPLRCAWCHNPESWRRQIEVGYLAERCRLCGNCVAVCPSQAITIKDGQRLFAREICVVCGRCVQTCENRALELIGREVAVSELAAEAIRDKPFFDNSGGGVTITGGEATLQPEFLLALLREIKAAGVHTALETCGQFPSALLDDLLLLVDLFLFDLKVFDENVAVWAPGSDPVRIRENFYAIVRKAGKDRIIPRIPVIPGYTVAKKNLLQIVALLSRSEFQGTVHLMPYNKLAKSKWEKVGRGADYTDCGELSEERLRQVAEFFEQAGFPVQINR